MVTEHVHRWTIDAPEGATSTGRCECGETRAFSNSLDDVIGVEYDPLRRTEGVGKRRPSGFDYADLPPVASPRDIGRWHWTGVEGCYTSRSVIAGV